MKRWQSNHVEKNLLALIKLTRCTTLVKTELAGKRFLTDEEVEYLTRLGHNQGSIFESRELYKILETRIGGYEALLEVLEGTCQTGACQILRTISIQNEVHKFLNLPVKCFGRSAKLNKIVPRITNEEIRDILKCPEARKEFYDLVSSESASVKLDGAIPKPRSMYIPRSISNRFLINPKLFKKYCEDVFVFKGIERNALVKLVQPNVIRSSSTQRTIVTCRHIYLDAEEDWDDLILVCRAPIHLVIKQDLQYLLQRTSRVTDILRKYSKNRARSRDAYISERKFAIQFLSDRECKGALVCDVPGMGKTYLMEMLARLFWNKSDNQYVFFIQLSSFSDYLSKSNQTSYEDLLYFVIQYTLRSKLAQKLVEVHCCGNNANVVIICDGFDEVMEDHVIRTTEFLRRLNEKKNVRFVISSRPHMRSHLEQNFGLISYDILPFAVEDQVKALVGHWRLKWPTGDQQRLHDLAYLCINSIKEIQTPKSREILGDPLKCHILAVLNETLAGQVSSNNRPLPINEMVTVESITQLYEQFVCKSFAKLKSDRVASDFQQKMTNFHTFKAFELLYPTIAMSYKSLLHLDPAVEVWVPKAGILSSSYQNELQFAHRSFAEFFVGKFFAELWTSLGQHEPKVVEIFGVYFLDNILEVQRFHTETLERSVGEMISSDRHISLQSERVTKFRSSHTVLWFMNSFYRYQVEVNKREISVRHFKQALRSWRRIMMQLPPFSYRSRLNSFKRQFGKRFYEIILTCIDEGFSSILSLLVQIVKCCFAVAVIPGLLRPRVTEPRLFRKGKRHQKKKYLALLLSRVAAKGLPEMAQDLFQMFGDSNHSFLLNLCRNFPAEYISPIEVAIEGNDLDMAVYFEDKMNLPWERLFVRSLITSYTVDETNAEYVNTRLAIINQVVGVDDRILSFFQNEKIENYELHMKSISYGHLNITILYSLALQKDISLISARWENKPFLLEKGFESNDEDIFKLVLLLFGRTGAMKSYDHQASNLSDISADQILHALDKQDAQETFLKLRHTSNGSSTSSRVTYFFGFIHKLETFKLLVGLFPDFSQCYGFRVSYLHYAYLRGKIDWVKVLAGSGQNVNQRTKHGDTPLHYITQREMFESAHYLVEKGANIYAVNYSKENCLHHFLRRCSKKDFTDIYAVVRYTIVNGFSRLLQMRDRHGSTPLDIVSFKLGRDHPTYTRLLQETSDIMDQDNQVDTDFDDDTDSIYTDYSESHVATHYS